MNSNSAKLFVFNWQDKLWLTLALLNYGLMFSPANFQASHLSQNDTFFWKSQFNNYTFVQAFITTKTQIIT